MAATTETVLGKTMAILTAFTAEDRVLTLAELTRRTRLHKATTHRLCRELVEHRLLDKAGGGYRLSLGLFELGMRASEGRSLAELAIPFLQDLYERTHETVHLGVRHSFEVVYVVKIGGHRPVRSPSRLGGRMPMHCTAIGKVLLANSEPEVVRQVLAGPLERRTPHTIVAPGMLQRQLQTIVEQGVAFEHEESAPGVVCVAAPVFDADDRAVAAMSITGQSGRFRPEQHAVALRAAAAAMAVALVGPTYDLSKGSPSTPR